VGKVARAIICGMLSLFLNWSRIESRTDLTLEFISYLILLIDGIVLVGKEQSVLILISATSAAIGCLTLSRWNLP
jgi:hypothetical protein